MDKFVLFSPVGTTDPICNYHDGALLHICRNYKPEKVYLYITQEMYELQKMDDRFRYSLNKLGEKLNHIFVIEEICRQRLTEVQLFDYFYEDFEKLLKKIEQDNREYKILLNISSGTPAIKGVLQTIAALSENRYTAIQVSTPEKKSNPKKDDVRKYDIEAEWQCNEDNDDDKYENRSTISVHSNLLAKIKKEIICKHLDVYDYNAAFSIAKGINNFICEDCMKLLEAATCRLQLNKSGVDNILKGTQYHIYPLEHAPEREIFEFILWLKLKQNRGDYADFIRGLTPLVVDLLEIYLQIKLNLNIKAYCQKRIKNNVPVYMLKRNKLQSSSDGCEILSILDGEFKGFKDCMYTSAHLAAIIEHKSKDKEFINDIHKIRSIEENARNLAAHEIVSITDEWIIQRCAFSSLEILILLKSISIKTGIKIKEDDWNSYDLMNEKIRSIL